MEDPPHPLERIGKFFPFFIIILIIIIAIVYLQSIRLMSDAGVEERSDTILDVQSDISRAADRLFENLGFSASSFLERENKDLESSPLPSAEEIVIDVDSDRLEQKKGLVRAIEFINPSFVNSDDFRLIDLVGRKVVVLDFCTFSSMNCIRGFPFMQGIHDKYEDSGLEIVTVVSPEFVFDSDPIFLGQAADDFGISYPVIFDGKYYTWRAYGNKYWPTRYLIDIDGFISESFTGEGHYSDIESGIRKLLLERSEVLGDDIDLPEGFFDTLDAALDEKVPNFSLVKTPTVYLGTMKNRGDFGNDEGFMANFPITYSLPIMRIPNVVYVEGKWLNHNEYLELVSESGRIVIDYSARDVDIIAGGGSLLEVSVDSFSKGDVFVNNVGAYHLVSGEDYGSHSLEIVVHNPGLRIYSLQFS